MRQGIMWILIFNVWGNMLLAQCDFPFRAYDDFDSTLTIAMPVINIGYMIPSNFETVDGPKMVEEGKLLLSYTEEERDTGIISLFLTIAVQEYEYYTIEKGEQVLLALSDSTVVGLYDVPDSQFDRSTNMRRYTHMCPLPIDVFYKMIHYDVLKIRIKYKNYKHDFELLPWQKKSIKDYLICLGTEAGFYKP